METSDSNSSGPSSVDLPSISESAQSIIAPDKPVSEGVTQRNLSDQLDQDNDDSTKFSTSKREEKPSPDIDDKFCHIWPGSPEEEGFTHHASFGDSGTTATVSRFGDIMQVTRFLGQGKSGIFSMDQNCTKEPYWVVQRAQDLDKISKDPFARQYSYYLRMNVWPHEPPDIIKWVNGRWPRFEWKRKDKNIVFQYYVHNGVVLQQLLFENLSPKVLKLDLFVGGDMKIRDLDFLSPHDDTDLPSEPLKTALDDGRVRVIKPLPAKHLWEPAPYQIGASIDVLVNGERPRANLTADGQGEFRVRLEAVKQWEVREIVAAYSLSAGPHDPGDPEYRSWNESVITASEADVSSLLSAFRKVDRQNVGVNPLSHGLSLPSQTTQTRAPTSTHSPREENNIEGNRQHTNSKPNAVLIQKIRYLTARHLEHILSVCAVPIAGPQEKSGKVRAVALSCGDMSSHRICTSASFFAFQFLIDIARLEGRQSLPSEDDHVPRLEEDVQQRIQETCEGHMLWLERAWENSKPETFKAGCFTANYWVTGEKMSPDGDTWQPSDCVTDTAFQILKMTEFAKAYPRSKLKETVQSLLTKVFLAWLHDLDRLDYRGQLVWPRQKQDGVDTYRLEDHFWVWRALLAMEEQGMWSNLPLPNGSTPRSDFWYKKTEAGRRQGQQMKTFRKRMGWSTSDSESDLFDEPYNEFYMITRRITPTQVRRSVLQRFTTVNDVSGVRMLPVSRSSRHTQFLLHDRDTAMFHDPHGQDFFQDGASQSLWDETIKAQPYHPDNEKSGSKWFTVMRYALGIMMGAKGQSLNNKKASDALWDSYETLLHFFNHNGFLGEQLDELSREPILFDDESDRDSYFHASFEVTFVLFTHAEYLKAKPDKTEDKQESKRCVKRIKDQMSELLLNVESISTALHVRTHLDATGNRQHRSITRPMMENIPFNNHMVSSRVHPIEEEWVYNYPEFLSAPEIELTDSCSQCTDTGDNACGENLRALIADAKKQKRYGELRTRKFQSTEDPELEVLEGEALLDKLGKARRARDAKKRCICLPDPNTATCQVYSMASASEVEKQAVTLFFDRHFQHVKDVQDETSLALNVWNSEVHISFLCLMDKAGQDELNGDRKSGSSLAPFQFPGAPNKVLGRTSMSYRFHGDIFDRYWTCHVLDSGIISEIVDDSGLQALLPEEIHESVFTDVQKALWQRTVLELVLLMRMLGNVLQHILSITGALHELLAKNPSPAPQNEPKSQSDASSLQDQCIVILDELERDLTSTLEMLQKWDDRRKNHGEEKPRWTLKDEDKYRSTIRGVQAALDKKRSEIQNQREYARDLHRQFKRESEQKEAEVERKRAARDAHSEKNIRWFTYITIVFAPLGFAEGFFSMGGAPSYELIRSLATFSAAALAVTVILLLLGITTFSVLEGRQSAIISAGKEPDQGLWGLLASTILELIARVVPYLMNIWKSRAYAKAIPAFIFAVVLGIPILFPIFVITWLIKLLAVTIGDIYKILKNDLYEHSGKCVRQKDPKHGGVDDVKQKHTEHGGVDDVKRKDSEIEGVDDAIHQHRSPEPPRLLRKFLPPEPEMTNDHPKPTTENVEDNERKPVESPGEVLQYGPNMV